MHLQNVAVNELLQESVVVHCHFNSDDLLVHA